MLKFTYNILLLPFLLVNTILNYLTFKFTNTSYEEFPKTHGRIKRRGNGKLEIGKKVILTSSIAFNPVGLSDKLLFYVSESATINIGNNVGISNSLFYSTNNIIVEDNVLIGGGCQILDTDFHSLDYHERIFNGDNKVISCPILIKEGAFIGTSSIILKGVTIGSRSIIGAGSIVTRSVPNNEVWAGNPAKFIKGT